MIRLYKDDSNYGVILFSSVSGKQLHSEICDEERFKELATEFFTDKTELYIPKGRQDLVEDIISTLPFIIGVVRIVEIKNFNMNKLLTTVVTTKNKKRPSLQYVSIGLILGAALLIPTSAEYSSSVLAQVESVKVYLDNEQDLGTLTQNREKLYLSVGNLYSTQQVDIFSYREGKYSVVFSSKVSQLKVDSLGYFPNSQLTLVTTLEKDEELLHVYRLEGSL